jgi:hypothetical protein
MDHHRKDCENISICYKCKEDGHMVVECAEFHSKSKELKIFGFSIQDQGFYIIRIAGGEKMQRAACIIQVLQGEATEMKIEEELKNLINNKWNWQVKQMEGMNTLQCFLTKIHWTLSPKS